MFTLTKEQIADLKFQWERVDKSWKELLSPLCRAQTSEEVVAIVGKMTQLANAANNLQAIMYKGDPDNQHRFDLPPGMPATGPQEN